MNQPNAELSKLQQTIRESRSAISHEYTGLLSDLDIRKRFTESVKHHPLGWIGGAAAAGLLATIFGGHSSSKAKNPQISTSPTAPSQKSETTALSKAGWIAGALELGKILFPILRPVVIQLATNAAKAGLAKRLRP